MLLIVLGIKLGIRVAVLDMVCCLAFSIDSIVSRAALNACKQFIAYLVELFYIMLKSERDL